MPKPKKHRPRLAKSPRTRKRLAPAIRKDQIIDAAARLVVQQGFLPLQMEKLAKAADSSKALIYVYFPEQHALFNAVLDRELTGLLASGLDTAFQVRDLDQAALRCALLYFEHVARAGPLLNILMSDRYMSGHVDRRLIRLRNSVLRRLARLAQLGLPLARKEILAAMEMMAAIPEEAGRLVFHHELDHEAARQICQSLIVSSLQALRAAERPATASVHDVARSAQNHRET